ncbi:MAG: SUMF1/EgtB/PvdO family nonheme iron enzyme [Acidimicrobiales bacterium]|nr:SUMF1/EgtB/PvdO family nonheme iron enzyme [Acidimicrobiales bacterium]
MPALPIVAPEPEADLAGSGPLLARFGPAVAELCSVDAGALLALLADAALPFDRRLAAATVLALIGDPRFDARRPDMVDIPGATVRIGLAADRVDRVAADWGHVGVERAWIAKEAPAHTVAVASFRIGRYPVTNAEYLQFVLARPDAARPTGWAHGTFPWAAANHPVYSLPAEATEAYAAWLSAETGRTFRLPTEAEWEYAATGGQDREFPWGDEWDPARANTAESGPLHTTPVGIYHEGRSPFGLYDVAGNVEEYVSDRYAAYPGGETVDDDLTSLYGESYRIARGGSYARHGDLARCRRRHGWYPSDHYAMGFRLAEAI